MTEVFEPGYFYHFLNRGNNKENIFINDENYVYFLNLAKKHLLSVCDIYCYCLLKNHFHFLLRIKDFEELPEKIQKDVDKLHQPFSNLFNAYAKGFNKAFGRTGSLFQEHPQKNRITDLAYLQHVIVYIHLNPLKHGFTENFKDYKHSSFQTILSKKPTKIKRNDVIEVFDDLENLLYCHDLRKIKMEGILKDIEKMDD